MNPSPSLQAAAVVLAAGASMRLGQPKQLLSYRGTTLLRCAACAALGSRVARTIVVLGAHHDVIKPSLTGLAVQVLINEQWEEGIASSIRTAISAMPDYVDAAILLVCDQPALSLSLIDQLITEHQRAMLPIVASEYGCSLGVPALFARSFFDELLKLQGDRGAKSIILGHLSQVARVPFPEGADDIDTIGDLPGGVA